VALKGKSFGGEVGVYQQHFALFVNSHLLLLADKPANTVLLHAAHHLLPLNMPAVLIRVILEHLLIWVTAFSFA
jgi:hypothetical protein